MGGQRCLVVLAFREALDVVVNHAIAPDASGGLLLSLYCERQV